MPNLGLKTDNPIGREEALAAAQFVKDKIDTADRLERGSFERLTADFSVLVVSSDVIVAMLSFGGKRKEHVSLMRTLDKIEEAMGSFTKVRADILCGKEAHEAQADYFSFMDMRAHEAADEVFRAIIQRFGDL